MNLLLQFGQASVGELLHFFDDLPMPSMQEITTEKGAAEAELAQKEAQVKEVQHEKELATICLSTGTVNGGPEVENYFRYVSSSDLRLSLCGAKCCAVNTRNIFTARHAALDTSYEQAEAGRAAAKARVDAAHEAEAKAHTISHFKDFATRINSPEGMAVMEGFGHQRQG